MSFSVPLDCGNDERRAGTGACPGRVETPVFSVLNSARLQLRVLHLGRKKQMGRDRKEGWLIAALIVVTVAMIALTVWGWLD